MKDWKKVLGAVAPSLATALGGPLAGLAVREIAGKVLGRPDASEADVASAVAAADPATFTRLRELDLEFEKLLASWDVDLARLAAGDVANARAREIALRDWLPQVLASVIVVGFLGSAYMLLSGHVRGLSDPTTLGVIGPMLGYLSAKADTVIGYYFGSSFGSRQKTIQMGKALEDRS